MHSVTCVVCLTRGQGLRVPPSPAEVSTQEHDIKISIHKNPNPLRYIVQAHVLLDV